MNIEQLAKLYDKSTTYEYYSHVVDDIEDYDFITRKKMLQRVLTCFQEIGFIDYLINVEEFMVLDKLIKTNDYSDQDIPILDGLCNRFLIIDDFKNNSYSILEEFKPYILQALTNKTKTRLLKDKHLLNFIPQIIKVYGAIDEDCFSSCLKFYFPTHKDLLKLFFKYTYFQQFYCHDYHFYTQFIVAYCYDDIFDNLLESYQELPKFPTYFIPAKTIESLFLNQLDLTKKSHKKLNHALDNLPFFIRLDIIKTFTIFVHCQYVIDENFNNYVYFIQDRPELIPLFIEAYEDMPSAALGGLTSRTYQMKKIESNKQNKPIQKNAHLSNSDALLFYKIFFGILEYTNNHYHINPSIKKIYKQTHLNPADIISISDYFFSHKEIITAFIKVNPFHFTQYELNLLKEFENAVSDVFFVVQYDKDYTYVMSQDIVYAIKGLHCNIDEIIPSYTLPYGTKMNLIPFKDHIIYDGIISGMNIHLPNQIKQDIQQQVQNAFICYKLDKTVIN